jgi:hypothetical protein
MYPRLREGPQKRRLWRNPFTLRERRCAHRTSLLRIRLRHSSVTVAQTRKSERITLGHGQAARDDARRRVNCFEHKEWFDL